MNFSLSNTILMVLQLNYEDQSGFSVCGTKCGQGNFDYGETNSKAFHYTDGVIQNQVGFPTGLEISHDSINENSFTLKSLWFSYVNDSFRLCRLRKFDTA